MKSFVLPLARGESAELGFRQILPDERAPQHIQRGRELFAWLRDVVPWGVVDGIRAAVRDELRDKAPARRRVYNMRRFENVTAGHYKFWEIGEVDRQTFEVRYGMIGSDGARARKRFASRYEMRAAWSAKITEKQGKGYHEVWHGAPWETEA